MSMWGDSESASKNTSIEIYEYEKIFETCSLFRKSLKNLGERFSESVNLKTSADRNPDLRATELMIARLSASNFETNQRSLT